MSLSATTPDTRAAKRSGDAFSPTRRHLLGLEALEKHEIVEILDAAETFITSDQRHGTKRPHLADKVIVNLFFEPSTRTRTSFSLAARRLSADVLDFTPSSSSLSK